MAGEIINPEGQPLPMDPLTGISPIAAAASQAMPQDMAQTAAKLVESLSAARAGFTGGGMIPGPTPVRPITPPPPIKQDPASAIAQGPFASVGARKRADTAALYSNISSLVNQANERHYQQKVEKLQLKFDTLGKAMQGIQEGKATGNQEMVAHNTRIINEMMSDPKTAKEMAKAFDVNMNPMAGGDKKKQKPTPELEAMQKSFANQLKAYQADKTGQTLSPQAQAMVSAMPQNLQADPRYQQYLEGLKAGAYPKAGELLTFQKGVMDVQEKLQNNKFTNETKMQMSKNLAEAMMDRTKMQQYGSLLRTQLMQLGANQRAEIMAEALKYRADQALKGQSERTSVMRDKLGATASDEGKKLKLFMDGLDKAAKDNAAQMKIAEKDHDTARMAHLAQQAEGIAYQQRLANDRAATMVNLDPSEPPDPKKMGLSDSEYLLFKEIFTDQTQPSGKEADSDEEE